MLCLCTQTNNSKVDGDGGKLLPAGAALSKVVLGTTLQQGSLPMDKLKQMQ